MKRSILMLSLAAGFAVSGVSAATAQVVKIDGSSTVFPVSEALAEEFQKETGVRATVGLSGTGGGFKKFCRGDTDFSGASRPIRSGEMEKCENNGIEYIELPIAMDGLANIVHPDNDWVQCMTVAELGKIWEPEAQGKIDNWNQVRDSFPDRPLRLFGAGVDSGTYDYYTKAIVGKEHSSRGDYTATEDDNVTIQGVSTDENALGFLGLAYLEENKNKVKGIGVKPEGGECVKPTPETAADGSYQPLTRPLFLYVKNSALEKEHVKQFVDFMLKAENTRPLVAEVGYVPLPAKAFDLAAKKVDNRKTGTFFGGTSKIGVSIEDLLN